MFPLVYGKTKVLLDSGQMGLENALDSVGRGQTALYQPLGPHQPG
jgi:hypothetical protein